MTEPTQLPLAQIEAEADRVRLILDNEPPNDNSDMLYAAYNALLYALGYNVHTPAELWGMSSEDRRKSWQARRSVGQCGSTAEK